MHLRTSIEIPNGVEHLESDRDTPKVSEAGAILNPPGPDCGIEQKQVHRVRGGKKSRPREGGRAEARGPRRREELEARQGQPTANGVCDLCMDLCLPG